ncbi:DUF4833 domain-containing protein [Sediminibacterium sp. TEGAF015]|uniref:DUF4833 domain-containing protein n=1 Tax=Sediminibacterium sp. TEGAF015 TaxID=575378 RepID=UPI00220C9F9F|nr:DUF4833 domain-containing protein [Sediminibacterium sp. TEGAF015]BDQ11227.1 hypothetical protein TEGAF0_04440 [Sediminibacterium sp. TEGAF015]
MNLGRKRFLVFLILLTGIFSMVNSGIAANRESVDKMMYNTDPQDTFPVPVGIKNQLFYLQRTTNTNTIIYSLNVNDKGELDESTPVKVFWIRYPEGGMRKELNFIQKAFAYGTISRKNRDGSFTIQLVAYKKKEFTLKKSLLDNTYKMYTLINNKESEIKRVYIQIDPGGTLFNPNVRYIEMKGKEAATNKPIMERFKP